MIRQAAFVTPTILANMQINYACTLLLFGRIEIYNGGDMSGISRKTYSGIQYVNVAIERLQRIVADMKLTDYQLAKLSGVNQSSISRWWSGNVEVRLSNLCSVCKAIGVSVVDLLEEGQCNEGENLRHAKQLITLLDDERQKILLSFGDYLVQEMMRGK